MPNTYFAASGYSSADLSQPDLSVFRLTEDGHIFTEYSMRMGTSPSYCTFSENELYVASEMCGCCFIDVFSWTGSALVRLRKFSYSYSKLCHLTVHEGRIFGCAYGSGEFFCADAHSGEILWEYRSAGGTLHAHGAAIDREHGTLLTADLGTGEVAVFALTDGIPSKKLCSHRFTDGEGPRHLTVSGQTVYCTLELASEIAVFRYDGEKLILTDLLDTTKSDIKNYPADSNFFAGRIVVGNRGADTLCVFITDNGKLTMEKEAPIGRSFPRKTVLSPDGRLFICACQKSDCIAVFDAQSLSFLDEKPLHRASGIAFL